MLTICSDMQWLWKKFRTFFVVQFRVLTNCFHASYPDDGHNGDWNMFRDEPYVTNTFYIRAFVGLIT